MSNIDITHEHHEVNTPWYTDALAAFNGRLQNYSAALAAGFKTCREKCPEIADVKTCVSIGPARGDVDTAYLQLLHHCRQYTGVEPDEQLISTLVGRLQHDHPQLDVVCVNTTIEVWNGPTEPVDLIIASHVMYHFNDPIKTIIQMLKWLRPGGLLIIILGEQNSISKVGTNRGLFAPGSMEDYRQPNLRVDLAHIKAEVIVEEPVYYNLDLKNKTDSLANFYLRKQCTRNERDELFSLLDNICPSGTEKHTDWLTGIRKASC